MEVTSPDTEKHLLKLPLVPASLYHHSGENDHKQTQASTLVPQFCCRRPHIATSCDHGTHEERVSRGNYHCSVCRRPVHRL
ncbi:hypothetical protein BsWGS_15456 [Bradybaena similaris]